MRTGKDEVSDPDGVAKPRSVIVSVVSGKVKHADQAWKGKKGYGIRVVIEGDDNLFYIHAHCYKALVRKGDIVVEHQPIAIVGRTGIATSSIPDHLHFEVSSQAGHNIGAADETELGELPLYRQDPLEMLAKLGSWGESDTFLPHNAEKTAGNSAEALHRAVEQDSTGGYFPLGANNFWHGGVHLSMPVGHVVYAPFGGTVVAARLGSDPDAVNGAYGSTNFILLRHEIGVSAFRELQRKPGDPPPPPSIDPKPTKKNPAVGMGKSNPAVTVKQVKRRLFELGHYPTDENEEQRLESSGIDGVDVAAIKSFQIAVGPKKKSWESWWPDGVIDVPGHTWSALFPKGPPEEPGGPEEPEPPPPESLDPERTIYSLFMHLEPLDADAALAKGIAWLPPEVDDDQAEAISHKNTTDVAGGMGAKADVAWVKKRLIRFKFFAEGGTDDEFDAAIRSFQDQHPFKKESKKKWVDGLVGHTGGNKSTIGFLRKTAAELGGEPPVAGVDRELVAKLNELGPDGAPSVLVDEDLRTFFPRGLNVAGGDPLWASGTAAGFEGDGGTATKEEIHWEMFS
ncbi:MAG: peptidoglycan DD-metalloendopeptidase family protein, partial [Nannocystaceae bacterium]|nr:peptidoglycan DD-metalloendopeptidase family protein [Nannocystaceae bacterium]